MSERDLPPLPSDVRGILDLEQGAPDPAETAKARVRLRVLASLGLGLGPVPGGAATPSLSLGLKLGLGLVVAGGIGVAAYLATRPATRAPAVAPAPSREVERPAPIVTPLVPAPDPAAAPVPASEPRPPRAPLAPRRVVAEPAEDLAAERALVEKARASLVQGEAAAALAPLSEHERRFPRGQLVEERESLRIRALARSGRTDEARAHAERFHQRYPRSLFRRAVEAAIK